MKNNNKNKEVNIVKIKISLFLTEKSEPFL